MEGIYTRSLKVGHFAYVPELQFGSPSTGKRVCVCCLAAGTQALMCQDVQSARGFS